MTNMTETKCPNCGAVLRRQTGNGFKCDFCGSEFASDIELEEQKAYAREKGRIREAREAALIAQENLEKGFFAFLLWVFGGIYAFISSRAAKRENRKSGAPAIVGMMIGAVIFELIIRA